MGTHIREVPSIKQTFQSFGSFGVSSLIAMARMPNSSNVRTWTACRRFKGENTTARVSGDTRHGRIMHIVLPALVPTSSNESLFDNIAIVARSWNSRGTLEVAVRAQSSRQAR